MKGLVVGGSGQIGGWLLRALADRSHDAIGTYTSHPVAGMVQLDAGDRAAVADLLGRERPDAVFYPAGFTWVDGCERDPDRCRRENVDQPLAVARAAAEVGARFVHFSTDYLFDGAAGPYAEDDPPHPVNTYGQAKLDAEHALLDALGDAVLIARTCWVFGPERQGKNFAYQLVRALRDGKPMTLPADQRSSPSYAPDVARAAVELAEAGTSGILHVAGPEFLDRPAFARAIAAAFGLDPAPIQARPTAELAQGAPRPLDAGLRTPRLDALRPGLMRPLAATLADFVARLDAGEGWADPRV